MKYIKDIFRKSEFFHKSDVKFIEELSKELELETEVLSDGRPTRIYKLIIFKPATNKFARVNLCNIFKRPDEYYEVSFGGSRRLVNDFKSKKFKCDQLDGLEKILIDSLKGGEERWKERNQYR